MSSGDTPKKIKMDEKTRKLLEGICPFNVNATVKYIPEIMKRLPDEYRPKFILRPLKTIEIKEFRKALLNVSSVSGEDLESEIKKYVRLCIMDISDMYDAGTGELIEFKSAPDGGMDKDIFELIPSVVVADLVGYLTKISGLQDIDKKSL
jgi:hypothetical protein